MLARLMRNSRCRRRAPQVSPVCAEIAGERVELPARTVGEDVGRAAAALVADVVEPVQGFWRDNEAHVFRLNAVAQ